MARGWQRILPWLAPPLTVVAILAVGHGMDRQEQPFHFSMPEPPPPAVPEPAASEITVALQAPDGAPAAGALLLVLEPEPALAVAGPDGIARARVQGSGPYRAWAYRDGCVLLRPEPFSESPRRPWRFAPLPDAPAALDPPLRMNDRRLRVLDAASGAPLQGALVLAGEHSPSERDFALAFTAADGRATLLSAPPGPLSVHVYAPLLPNVEAWKLISQALAAADGLETESELRVTTARLALRGLPAGELLRGERLDVPGQLPLHLVPPSGIWDASPLPPGRYRFTVLGTARELDVTAGETVHDWTVGAPK